MTSWSFGKASRIRLAIGTGNHFLHPIRSAVVGKLIPAVMKIQPSRLCLALWCLLCLSAPAAEEARDYPLGPIGGQYRISGGEAYARIVALDSGGPGATAGLQVNDHILGAFGKSFTPTGSYHYGVSQDLGFAVDRAEGGTGALPLRVMRPGVGGLDITVALPAAGAFSPAYPRNDAKYAAMYESSCAWLHSRAMSSNGSMGYFTGWTGLALLSHPNWNDTTGAKPYRLSINKIRDFVIGQIGGANYSPNEDKIILLDGTITNNPNHQGGMSNWQLGQMVMFLSEYFAKTADPAVVATLQRGAELCSNSIQWWKQPDISGTGYSPGYSQIAGMVSHGGVTGDYIHLGWGGGINMCGAYSFNGMAFARSAGMNMGARPRDGHYYGYDPYPATLMPVVPAGMENYDHTIDEKFLMQMNWMINRCGGFSAGSAEDGHVCYTLQGWSSYDAGGRTPGALLGMALYKRDGGVLNANDEDRLERMKGYVARQYMKHQEAHAYCVGAQAYQQFATPFLSDRQQRFFMDNWKFYYALMRTHSGGFQYFRSRSVADNYLDETHCAALNAALPYGIANGGYSLIPGYKTDRLLARFDNPDITWPTLDARKVSITGTNTLSLPIAMSDGNGTVLDPATYSATWSKISGAGTVTFGTGTATFSQSGNYRIQLAVTSGANSLVEPIDVNVVLFTPTAGFATGSANYQVFTGISGSTVANLTGAVKFPNAPDITRTVNKAAGDYSGDNYGARLSGLIIPPVTGSYRFYIASDDNSQLKINSAGIDPTGASVVATVGDWTNANQWTKYASQQSAVINLTAGQPIWFEALQKEGGGGDNLSVGWAINGAAIEVIDGVHLAAAVPAAATTMAIVTHPQAASAAPGGSINLSVTTAGPSPALYQWRRNGVAIGSPTTSPTFSLTNVSGGAEGDYDVVYTTDLGSITSNAAHVSITGTGGNIAGGLWREVFTDIGGDTIPNLTGNAKYPNFADSSGVIPSAAAPSGFADNYGQRWTGWITPLVSGNYRFYLASDDNSEIWLGTTDQPASATRILTLSGYTDEKWWSSRSPSAYYALSAGVRYYIEVRHKEGGGGDHCAVAWQRQGDAAPTNGSGEIPGTVLSYRNGGIYPDIPLEDLPPVFVANPVTKHYAIAGSAYSGQTLAGAALDPNGGDTISFSRTAGPAWLTVAANGGLGGTPSAGDIGTAVCTVRATDGAGNFSEASLEIPVVASNAAPAFTANPLNFPDATALLAYSAASLAGYATDADAGQSRAFSLVSGPSWLSVAANGTLSGTPAIANVGRNEFTVRVTDSLGDFSDTVLVIQVNHARYHYDLNGTTPGSGVTTAGTWDGTAQWSLDATGTAGPVNWLNGVLAVFAAGNDATGSYTVTLDANRTVAGMVFQSGSALLSGGGITPGVAASALDVTTTATGARIDSPISGSNGISKTGPGTLVIGGNNTYTGNTTINNGVLELTTAGKLYNAAYNNSAVITIAAGGIWRMPDYSYGGVGQLADYRQRRVLDGGIIEVTGATHSSGQNFTVNSAGGTFRYAPAVLTNTLSLVGNANSNIQTNGLLTLDTAANISVTEIIEGTGGLAKTGNGILSLAPSGSSTYTGGTVVQAGRVVGSTNTAFGTGAITLGTTSADAAVYLGNRADISNPVTVSALGSGTVIIGADNTGSGANAATYTGTITANRATTFSGEVTADRLAIEGKITGNPGTLTVSGGARTTFSNVANDFTGNLVIAGSGTILQTSVASAAEVVPNNCNVTVESGAILQLASSSGAETINGLNGGGTVRNLVGGAYGFGIVVGAGGGSGDFTGTLANGNNALSFTKSGAGIQTLSGANTYTGTTSIQAGTLLVTGSIANSATTVAAAGTLGGTGSIGGATSVNGTLVPGNAGIGTLTTAALTLATGATIDWQMADWTGTAGSGYDRLSATSLNLTSATTINIKVSELAMVNFTNAARTFTLVHTSGGITGFAANKFSINKTGIPSANGTWTVQQNGTALELVYAPGNSAPVFSANPITGGTAAAGVAYTGSIAGFASDPDAGDTRVFSKITGPAWLNVAANGSLTGTPQPGDGGSNSFTVRVTDAGGLFANTSLNITVTLTPTQSWQVQNFGANATDPLIAGDTMDPDKDGVSNLIEYALGTNPNQAGSSTITCDSINIAGTDFFRLTIPRNPAATDVNMVVETCDNLTGWSAVSTFIETNTPGQLVVRDTGTGLRRFIRLRIFR